MFNEASSRAGDILRAGIATGRVRPGLDVERAVADVLSPFVYIRMIRFEKITDADSVSGLRRAGGPLRDRAAAVRHSPEHRRIRQGRDG